MKVAKHLQQEILQRNFNDFDELKNFKFIKKGMSYFIKIEDKKYRFEEYKHILEGEKKFLFIFKSKYISIYDTGIFYNEDLGMYFIEDELLDYLYEKTKKEIEIARQLLLK